MISRSGSPADFGACRDSIRGTNNHVEASEKEYDKDVEVKEKQVRKKNKDKNMNTNKKDIDTPLVTAPHCVF